MGRRYRGYRKRNRSYRGRGGNGGAAALVFLILCLFSKYWGFALFVVGSIGVIVAIRYFIRHTMQEEDASEPSIQYVPPKSAPVQQPAANDTPSYSSKGTIMSDCEKEYFKVIRQLVEPKYTVQPQINLASIVSKESHGKYRSELFRNVDFGIFDKDYNIKVLVEINDKTHTQADRIQRDKKVNQICAEAGIPLITFWTKYGINPEYIKDRLSDHLDLHKDTFAYPQEHSDCFPEDFS